MLVGVLQAYVENRDGLAAVEPLFELFLGDPFDRHGGILALPQVGVKKGLLRPHGTYRLGRRERQHLGVSSGRPLAWRGGHRRLLRVHRPTVRSFAAMDAAQEDRPRGARHAEVVTS